MWQLARIMDSEVPEVNGKFVWTLAVPPYFDLYEGLDGRDGWVTCAVTNVVCLSPEDQRPCLLWFRTETLERLDEFAEDVELIDWRLFEKGAIANTHGQTKRGLVAS